MRLAGCYRNAYRRVIHVDHAFFRAWVVNSTNGIEICHYFNLDRSWLDRARRGVGSKSKPCFCPTISLHGTSRGLRAAGRGQSLSGQARRHLINNTSSSPSRALSNIYAIAITTSNYAVWQATAYCGDVWSPTVCLLSRWTAGHRRVISADLDRVPIASNKTSNQWKKLGS